MHPLSPSLVTEVPNMDADFYAANRRRFFRQMEEGSLLLLFSGTPVPQSADSCYPFYVNRNFYYMTGVNAAGAVLLMAKNSSAPRETLFIPDPENASPVVTDVMVMPTSFASRNVL